jgi:hypothetical protein
MFEPATFGSSVKHTKHYTTKTTKKEPYLYSETIGVPDQKRSL